MFFNKTDIIPHCRKFNISGDVLQIKIIVNDIVVTKTIC